MLGCDSVVQCDEVQGVRQSVSQSRAGVPVGHAPRDMVPTTVSAGDLTPHVAAIGFV